MYCDFFGLKTVPFRVTPDTSLFYAGGEREALLNAIVYAISHGDGMVKVVGEVGSGKTMLTRMLEKKLPDSVTIIYLPNPSLAAKDLVFAIGHELGLELNNSQTKTHALLSIQNKLLEIHANNQRVVVFIDEAQCMPLDTLEELRLLTNLETETDKLLQLVLFGQPELDEHLLHPSVRQIKERIIHNLYLKPFSQAEIAEYLAFRLHKVGYNSSPLFSKSALKALAKYSDGLPRRLSILADKSMLAAFAAQSQTVTKSHVDIAHGDHSASTHSTKKRWPIVLGLTVILAVVGIGLFVLTSTPTSSFNASSSQLKNDAQSTTQSSLIESVVKNSTIESESISPSTSKQEISTAPAPSLATEEKREPQPQLQKPQKITLETQRVLDTPLLNQLLSKTEHWLNNPGAEKFTIQIMSTLDKDKNKLEKFLNKYSGQSFGQQLFIHSFTKNQQTLYAVTYGRFPKYQIAKEQLDKLPAAMKRFDPYIKTISTP
jgi:type II secretory pathway predicted ATPase ExeA/septal ring-binding cell division protein DamX